MGRDRGSADGREIVQMARHAAVLFGAAGLVTALGLLFPHQAEANDEGLALVAIAAGAMGAALAVARERIGPWALQLAVASGTILISLSLVFNGERDGGAAGGDEVYYLWIALYSAYYFGRRAVALQTALIAASYAAALYAIDPGPVAVSRWLTMLGLAIGAAVIVRLLSERNSALVGDLDRMARTDRLTGLANRLAFEERFEEEIARSERARRPLSLLLGDVDRLKEINDRWGHPTGDEALARVGRTLREELRPGDTAARIGGDEFAVLLPGQDASAARDVAARLSRAVREAAHEPTCTVGITFGVATLPAEGHARDDLLRVADIALYAAKPSRRRERAGVGV
jgi:diguanylate cyclase (GGDEF)-like protein